MGQVYLKDYEGPLYAYVDLRIADTNVVFSTLGGNASGTSSGYNLNHVTNYAVGDTYISNVVMSLACTKEATANIGGHPYGGSGGISFTLNVFDESAVYVEDLISSAITGSGGGVNCYIEYGWSAQGQRIEERSTGFEGAMDHYTLSFEGASTILSITGKSNTTIDIGSTYAKDADIPDDVTMTAIPSDIMQWICDNVMNNLGNGITYTLDADTTEPVDLNQTELANLTCNNKSLYAYIRELCSLSRTSDGRGNFSFWETVDPNNPSAHVLHFKSVGEVGNALGMEIGNEEGEVVGSVDPTAANGSPIRHYEYYGGADRGEVLSWSVDNNFSIMQASPGRTYAVDHITNEMLECDASSSFNPTRVMGLSSGAYSVLRQRMQDLWAKYATQVITASIDILGDANLNVQEYIEVEVYTKYNLLHASSGVYRILTVEDNVDTSGFTTSLTLEKDVNSSEYVTTPGQGEAGSVEGTTAAATTANTSTR